VQYNDTLQSMIGYVRNVKPNCPAPLCRQFLNSRIRQIIDAKPNWAGLIKYTTVKIPDAFVSGSINLTSGSPVVAGVAATFPTDDVVNSVIAAGVTSTGLQWVAPASMDGITADTILYVDAGGTNPEIVPVTEVRSTTFRANFRSPHNANVPITCSSLSGRQLVTGLTYPIFTVLAVKDSSTLILDAKWSGTSLANMSYSILGIYYTFATDIKEILSIVDPIQPLELSIHVPQRYIAVRDPRRQTVGSAPELFLDRSPNLCGNMQYEIYPPQSAARQLNMLYYQQWPDLEAPGDRPPTFINPGVILDGAMADAKRHKAEANDIYYDLAAAQYYEQRFMMGLGDAMNADNTKAQQQLEWNYRQLYGMGGFASSGSFAQQHDVGGYLDY
jgi:hypothetical protein